MGPLKWDPSLKLTVHPLKMDGNGRRSFPFGMPFFQVQTGSFREGSWAGFHPLYAANRQGFGHCSVELVSW